MLRQRQLSTIQRLSEMRAGGSWMLMAGKLSVNQGLKKKEEDRMQQDALAVLAST